MSDSRPAPIFYNDLQDLETAAELLVKHGQSAPAVRLWALALRLREATRFGADQVFACDVDESAGMAEVYELQAYSRRVPLKGCGA